MSLPDPGMIGDRAANPWEMPSRNEKSVNIAAKLYEARATCRRIAGDKYSEQIRTWMEAVKRHTPTGLLPLQSGMALAKACLEDGRDVAALWIFAATFELCEPNLIKPSDKKFPPPFESVEQCGSGGYVE